MAGNASHSVNVDSHEGIDLHGIELAEHKAPLYGEKLFSLGELQVTNSLLSTWIVVLVIVSISLAVRLGLKDVPGKLQTVFEVLVEKFMELCDNVTGDRAKSRKLFPLVISLFIFILLSNYLGIVPGVGTIGQVEMHDGHAVLVPFLRGATADVNTTLALTIISVVGANIFGVFSIGIFKYLGKFLILKPFFKPTLDIFRGGYTGMGIFKSFGKWLGGTLMGVVQIFVGFLETVAELAKFASLSFRLFGNVFAGEVLLATMASMLAYFLPIPFYFLEFIVGFVQALVFSILTLVYFTMAGIATDEH
jgi:F-type H+-transporting ATPase subunit a